MLDGALVLIGGVLFILPGFISDVFGALLLLPPSRAGVRRLLVRNFQGRFVRQMAGFSTGGSLLRRRFDRDRRRAATTRPMSDASLALRTLAFGDLDGAAWGVAWFPEPGLPGFVALGSARGRRHGRGAASTPTTRAEAGACTATASS